MCRMTDLGLPQIVMDFLKMQTESNGHSFKWKIISSDNGFSQLTLTWNQSSGSPTVACDKAKLFRMKSPSEIRRDTHRQKQYQQKQRGDAPGVIGQCAPSVCSIPVFMNTPRITRSKPKVCLDGDNVEIKRDHEQSDVSLPLPSPVNVSQADVSTDNISVAVNASHTSLESAASYTSKTPLSYFQNKDANVNDDVRKGCMSILDTMKNFDQKMSERFEHFRENFVKDFKLSI